MMDMDIRQGSNSRSIKPFSTTCHNTQSGAFEDPSILPPSQPMWVPFPGKKRKAQDSDIYLDKEYGPSPGKQCAIDESVAELVMNDDGVLIGTVGYDYGSGGMDLRQSECDNGSVGHTDGQDEEMTDEMDATPYSLSIDGPAVSNELEGVHHFHHENFEEVKIAGDGSDDGGCEVNLHETTGPISSSDCMKNKVKNPKLYFFEGLKEVLEKQNEESPLPRSLIQKVQKEATMALVLWKPGILASSTPEPSPPQLTSTSAGTTARNPLVKDDKIKICVADEDEKNNGNEDMDVCT